MIYGRICINFLKKFYEILAIYVEVWYNIV